MFGEDSGNGDFGMSEKPILFSGEMVRAIFDGRKTQTRRVIKVRTSDNKMVRPFPPWWIEEDGILYQQDEYGDYYDMVNFCPYGDPGDRLWVRETAWYGPQPDRAEYDADMDDIARESALFYGAKKKPSIYMPRWASRITLLIKDVRVERLQDINVDDAIAELGGYAQGIANECVHFMELWDSINAKRGYGWDTNPWVWVIEFEKMD